MPTIKLAILLLRERVTWNFTLVKSDVNGVGVMSKRWLRGQGLIGMPGFARYAILWVQDAYLGYGRVLVHEQQE